LTLETRLVKNGYVAGLPGRAHFPARLLATEISQCPLTSYRQIEANKRNALKSTGPKSQAGKDISRRNAVGHGLTAETVISALEDAEDYKAFEGAITADYDAQLSSRARACAATSQHSVAAAPRHHNGNRII
jgi:hypothetical protein